VHRYLRHDESNPPQLVFFENCVNMIRTMPAMIHDDLHPEDANSKVEDHAPDELRYIIQTFRDQAIPKPKTKVEQLLHSIKKQEEDFNFKYQK
ncbi:hypothetical protein LCGC14_2141900, partial [marine sediment metagenome]